MMVDVDPRLGIHRLAKAMKGRSSRLLRQEFKHLRPTLPTLWTNSYFEAAVGVPGETVRDGCGEPPKSGANRATPLQNPRIYPWGGLELL